MSSETKPLASIRYVVDHDCGNYYIGEIDGVFDNKVIEEYLSRFGEKGKTDLLNNLAYMQYQVINAWRNLPKNSFEGCTDKCQGGLSDAH